MTETQLSAAPSIRTWHLRTLVLVAGMSTMATEMAAARLLAPFFGASVLVWANIIGLILLYLSLGYWWGGRIADRHPHIHGLSSVILGAACAIAVVPFLAAPVLRLSAGGIDEVAVGSIIGSFVGVLLLFSVPITLLGMVPPYAMRLAISSVEKAGSTSGGLYALSTIGSIIGTFGSVLITIPLIGTRRTLLTCALILTLLSLMGLVGRRRIAGLVAAIAIAIAMAIPPGGIRAANAAEVIFEGESRYQFVQVVEESDGTRLLQLNEGWAVHSVYDPGSILTNNIWDHFLVVPALARGEGKKSSDEPDSSRALDTLIIGNAAGTAPRIFERFRPEIQIDGVEIDPLVSEVGRKYFKMGGENLRVHHADGRPYLAASDKKWDFIHIDAYRQPYIPFYLTTSEFFKLVKEHLKPGGVLSINVGAVPGDNRVERAIAASIATAFPQVFRYEAETYNTLLVAPSEEMTLDQAKDAIQASDLAGQGTQTQRLFTKFADGLEKSPAAGEPLTDDRAPVEWMTDGMIVQYAKE